MSSYLLAGIKRNLLLFAGAAAFATVAWLGYACASMYGSHARLVLLEFYAPMGLFAFWGLTRLVYSMHARERALLERLEEEGAGGKRLCLTAIESLAYAVEGRTSQNLGHLARVQAYATATAEALGMEADNVDGIRIAALVHDIGRLGVPDNILVKGGKLTEEEREKVRAYPVLGSRLLATIPFPWPIVPIVRHHREHFDGSGYPDGLSGERIPLGSRILGVVDTYDALISGGSHRVGQPHGEALKCIEEATGTQFDPQVVAAFRRVVERVNNKLALEGAGQIGQSAAYEIARAQREVQSLYDLACTVGSTLQLDDTLEMLAGRIMGILSCSTCVIFLQEGESEHLQAYSAFGTNRAHFRRSRARIGTYLTGRAISRREPVVASFLPDDVTLRPVSEPWTPLRSTLIVPLMADGAAIGTINLYHNEPDAFQPDDVRVMVIVGELAGRAVNNARLFAHTQETALTDPVTGLRNRRFLRQFLESEINRAEKNERSLAVLGLDLDRFKLVNDTYGHERGDQVLRDLGEVLQAQLRNYDLLARYAGDEFAVVLPETSRIEAEYVAVKIQDAVQDYAASIIAADPGFPRLGVSVGLALFPEDATGLQELLTVADRLMYENKRSTRQHRLAA